MASDHLLQHNSQHTALEISTNNALAPLSLLSQTAIDLPEVVGWLEFDGETSGFEFEVLPGGGEEWSGEDCGEGLWREGREEGDDGGEERSRDEIAFAEGGASERAPNSLNRDQTYRSFSTRDKTPAVVQVATASFSTTAWRNWSSPISLRSERISHQLGRNPNMGSSLTTARAIPAPSKHRSCLDAETPT